jgi:murein DD-endopeptidase MepM/ murein hydrolase activator NlpD/urea transporter
VNNTPVIFLRNVAAAYAQVFFSKDILAGCILLLATFCEPLTGLCGLASVLIAQCLSWLLRTNKLLIQNGTYTFNTLLTGLSLGLYASFSFAFILTLVITSSVVYLLTLFFAQLGSRTATPFLSLPFVAGMWLFMLHIRDLFPETLPARVFTARGEGAGWLNQLSYSLENSLPNFFNQFFHALAAILFQQEVIAGIIIALALAVFSRITFALALAGFTAGYFYFSLSTHNPELFETAAFNFILTSIAIGGFFFVPSLATFVLAIISTVVTALFCSLSLVTSYFYLPLYSLPFALSTIVLVAAVRHNSLNSFFKPVVFQNFSPEKNLYGYLSYATRFRNNTFIHIHLPFFGKWKVSQAHEGEITHKDEYRYAWDFVVADEAGRTFRLPGKQVQDFYCYGAYVLAPANGKVVKIEDGIDDNPVGQVNLARNWGNTIIIRHSENLFSKISHLQKCSFRVKEGDEVKSGAVLALCGNSGRSPEPHIHFQLQATEHIGAPTINYPVSYYAVSSGERFLFKSFDVPAENEIVMPPETSPRLNESFSFNPGAEISMHCQGNHTAETVVWTAGTDSYNFTFLKCASTGAQMYYYKDEVMFQSTAFSGDRSSMLYQFYIATQKIPLCTPGAYDLSEKLSPEIYKGSFLKLLQDFIAPFCIFLEPVYRVSVHDGSEKNSFTVLSSVTKGSTKQQYEININTSGITKFTIHGRL